MTTASRYPLTLQQIAKVHEDCADVDCDVKPFVIALRELREAAEAVRAVVLFAVEHEPIVERFDAALAKVKL